MTAVIPAESALHAALRDMASTRRVVIFAGLPGVGKSLLVQQLAIIAQRCGRRPHAFQWDVVRSSFETPELLARYPEVDGFTHPGLIARVGEWLRDAIADWRERYPSAEHMLIGEAALVGGRLVELVEPRSDRAEPLLASSETLFVLPVPSRIVRAEIERRRETTSVNPSHRRETTDARPNVLRQLWDDVYREAAREGFAPSIAESVHVPYDPDAYRALYEHWLRHRHTQVLAIDSILPVTGSVYEGNLMESELRRER